ncbi:MAG: protein-disulfide reductase DsbD domain-containing protein [Myxococcota bacterium]
MIRSAKFGWALVSVLCVGAALPVVARANPVEAPHLQASLVTVESAVVPGETVTAAVHFELEPEWHLYWKNPGDSGEAPTFEWRLPEGFVPSEVAWPAPRPIPVGPLMNYGYEGELLLPVTIDVPETLSQQAAEGAEVELTVVTRWLVCREDCIPGEATLTLTLPVRSEPTPPRKAHASLFAQVEREQPKPVRGRAVDDGDAVIVDIAVDAVQLGDAPRVTLFPYDALVLDHAANQEAEYRPDGVSLRVRKDPTRDTPLEALAGLVVVEGDGVRRVFELDTPVIREAAPAGMAPGSADTNTLPTSPENAPATPLAIVLLLAFGGGVLLNLMPCVFPVLSLKILGVLEHADDLAATRRDGRMYTAGVLSSFWVVAGLLLALRAGGERLGWGFQLQSPEFIAALAILMTLVALNLLGAFEVGMGLSRVGAIGATAPGEEPSPRHAMLSSFVTGALAVIVATPCTAPFMGTAVGFALTRSPGVALLVFTALGLGMALPYLALGYSLESFGGSRVRGHGWPCCARCSRFLCSQLRFGY